MKKISYQWETRSEQRDREENEDRSWAGEARLADGTKAYVAVVADGVGGALNGGEVATMTIAAFRKALGTARRETFQREDRLRAWCDELTEGLVADVAREYPSGGATLSSVIRVGRHVAVAWVGDSPIWRVGRGRVERWYRPHTQLQSMLDEGMSEESIPPGIGTGLMKSISGDTRTAKGLLECTIHVGSEPSWLVVGSDGVFNHVGGSELREIVETGGKRGAAKIARGLLARSLKNGRATRKRLDNATVAVLSWNLRRPLLGVPTMWVPEGGWKLSTPKKALWVACLAVAALLVLLGALLIGSPKEEKSRGVAAQKAGRVAGMSRRPGGGRGSGAVPGGGAGEVQTEEIGETGAGGETGEPEHRETGENREGDGEATSATESAAPETTDGNATEEPKKEEATAGPNETPAAPEAKTGDGGDESTAGKPKAEEEETTVKLQLHKNDSGWPVEFTDGTKTKVVQPGETVGTNWFPLGGVELADQPQGATRGVKAVKSPSIKWVLISRDLSFVFPANEHWTQTNESNKAVAYRHLPRGWAGKTDEEMQNEIEKKLKKCVSLSDENLVLDFHWLGSGFVAGRTSVLFIQSVPAPVSAEKPGSSKVHGSGETPDGEKAVASENSAVSEPLPQEDGNGDDARD